MNQTSHQHYYAARAAAARNLALRAATPAIAAIHATMAVRYDLMASQPEKCDDVIATVI